MPTAPLAAADPRRFLNPQDGCWHVQVTQGETYVSGDGNEILTTVLGSCIAACIRDPLARLGGMNHFLLAHGGRDDARYGVHAMEILINGLLARGAARARLEAKLFGGAKVMAGLSDIGHANAAFAESFLAAEGIPLVGGHLRGTAARRIQYWPVSGRARQRAMPGGEALAVRELFVGELAAAGPGEAGDVELF